MALGLRPSDLGSIMVRIASKGVIVMGIKNYRCYIGLVGFVSIKWATAGTASQGSSAKGFLFENSILTPHPNPILITCGLPPPYLLGIPNS